MKSADAVTALAALAQESRLAVFRLLVKRGPEGFTPGDLIERNLPLTPATLSFHLKALHHAGLLNVRREGRFLYYSPNFRHMQDLLGFLTDHCCELADDSCRSAECKPETIEQSVSRKKRA
jgi:ArsR family transcriptional regulator, arsenate/arsenite/antimonite-responsive transcriptional repressor